MADQRLQGSGSVVCPKCPSPRRTEFSGQQDSGYICEVHGWVEAVEMVPVDDAAIARAATSIRNRCSRQIGETHDGYWRRIAVEALRAAGGHQ